MFSLKYENPHLRRALLIIEICLSAPVSNASLERLFCQMNIIKSDVRNRLSNKALNAVLHIRTSGITIDDFQTTISINVSTFGITRKSADNEKQKIMLNCKGSPVKLQKGQNLTYASCQLR